MISEDGKWGSHIDKLCKKGNSTIGFLHRNLNRAPQNLKVMAYTTLVRSVLEYSCSAWDPHLVRDIKALEAVQRRGARFTCGDYGRYSSVTAMLKTLGWESLQQRRTQARLVMLYKVVNGLVNFPSTPLQKPISATRTRSCHDQRFIHLSTNTTIYKNSFFPRTVPEWNRLSQSTVDSESVETFKSRLKQLD